MPEKILLIRPQNIYRYNNYPALGLISLGSTLREAGFSVKIIDAAFEDDYLETITRQAEDALLVGLTVLTSEVIDAYAIARHIKEHIRVPIVMGGWHCTLFPEQMGNSEYVDYVVVGEGESHIVEIAESLRSGRPAGKRIFAKQILDMENLPLPDYTQEPDIERYINSHLTDKLSQYVQQPMRWLPYESSRGCPSQCTFCINVVTDNNRYRKKSASKTVDEIEEIVTRYKLTHLKIVDDNFFTDIKRVRDICQGILDRGIDITWDGECRCDYFNDRQLNDETLRLCKESGLVQLTLGIESGSPRTLELMKKGITTEQGEHAVAKCNEHGIIARSSFIIEIPGETKGDIKMTLAFINRLRRYPYFTCGMGTFRPYPRCELTETLLEQGVLPPNPDSFEAWNNRRIIDMYTQAEFIRPWQVDGKYSESACFYMNMESSVRLGFHQLDRFSDKLKYRIFMALAKIRNRMMFFGLPIDKKLYQRFLSGYYARRQKRRMA
jgi:anaerobic magnesium-protoporphyrin IX monomethyl ester cyclase